MCVLVTTYAYILLIHNSRDNKKNSVKNPTHKHHREEICISHNYCYSTCLRTYVGENNSYSIHRDKAVNFTIIMIAEQKFLKIFFKLSRSPSGQSQGKLGGTRYLQEIIGGTLKDRIPHHFFDVVHKYFLLWMKTGLLS